MPRSAAYRRLAPLLCAIVLVAACANRSLPLTPPAASPSASGVAGPDATPAPSAADGPGLLLEVESQGGFINPAASLSALPLVVVDDDGRIYTPAPPATGDQPLIPGVEVRDVGLPGVEAIISAVRAAGLDQAHDTDGVVADTGAIVFSVMNDGVATVSRFARADGGSSGAGGVGGHPGEPGMPGQSGGPDQLSGGAATPDPTAAAAFALLAGLTDPKQPWGPSAGMPVAYLPGAYRVYAAPDSTTVGTELDPPPAWPLAVSLATFGVPAASDFGIAGLRSGIVAGSDATTLAAGLRAVVEGTAISSAGRSWQVWIRPLLPGE